MIKTLEVIPKVVKKIGLLGKADSMTSKQEAEHNAELLMIIRNIALTEVGCTELIRRTAHKLPDLLKSWMDHKVSSIFLWEVLSLLENLSANSERARTVLRELAMLFERVLNIFKSIGKVRMME